MAHDVFISHSTNDKLIANAICSIFENNGIRCWIAPRDIVPGMEWVESIIDGISASRVMVLILSSSSIASTQVKREIEQAVNQDVIVIPFRIEEVELSKSFKYYLSGTHWLDAMTPPVESHIKDLLETVKRLLPVSTTSLAQKQEEEQAAQELQHQKLEQERLATQQQLELEKAVQQKLEQEKVAQKKAEQLRKRKKSLAWMSLMLVGVIVFMFLQPYLKQQKTTVNSADVSLTIPSTKLIEPEMVAITGGCFQIGSPKKEKYRDADEKQHEVCVENFEIGEYEITQAQWQALMDNNPSQFKGENLPVESVRWSEVQHFIEKLNQKTGKNYRLPTEAEWEYAARAGTTTPFYTGQLITDKQANFDSVVGKTTAIGSYPANPWGLYDMAGNVLEWTCSGYVEVYNGSEKNCISNNDSSFRRVVRGGSWAIYHSQNLRSAHRYWLHSDVADSNLGFRVARTL